MGFGCMYTPKKKMKKNEDGRMEVWMYLMDVYISDDPGSLETPSSSTAHSLRPKKTSESIDCRVISHDYGHSRKHLRRAYLLLLLLIR